MMSAADALVWQAFDQAADRYDQFSVLQQQSADFLCHLMQQSGDLSANALHQWLDIGCGTGQIAKRITAQGHRVIALDQSTAALAQLQGMQQIETIQADIRHLPFADGSIAALVSHFALHWLSPSILPELCRVATPESVLWLAMPVQGSLASVQARYPALPIFDFAAAGDWLNAAAAQPVEIVSTVEKCWRQPFDHLQDLLHSLKLMGGHRLGRAQPPIPPAQFRAWLREVEPIALEYQVLYMQLRAL
jgi:ubiquinone/menaquinone biosynthesis C-methylase UbiE